MPPTAPKPKTLLRTAEAAAQLNIKESTLEMWRVRGEGPPFVKLGKSVRYVDAALQDFIRSNTRTSTSKEG